MAESETKEALPDVSKGWGVEEFPLRHPFRFAGVEYRALSIRTPTGYDIDAFVRGKEATVRGLAQQLVDADAKVLDAMHGADYARLMSQLGKFVAGTA